MAPKDFRVRVCESAAVHGVMRDASAGEGEVGEDSDG